LLERARAALAQPGREREGPISERDLIQQWNAQADEFNQWESLDSGEQLAWAQARAIAADRNSRPEPAPESGEVSEIAAELLFHVAFMHSQEKEGWPVDLDLPPLLTRAADLLQQLSTPAPALVPVAVSERRPREEDCFFNPGATDGSCWCFHPVEFAGGLPWWSFESLEWAEDATHWLPYHAFPLPHAGEGEV